MTTVLDTYALLAYLGDEVGSRVVRDLLAEAADTGSKLLMTAVNIAEVLYVTERKRGRSKVAELEPVLGRLPLEVETVGLPLARQAASYKATRRMSLADCFAAALANARGGRVVTGDREFEAVEDEIEVLWL